MFPFSVTFSSFLYQTKHNLSVAFQSWTVAFLWNGLWNGLIDSVTEPGRVWHKVILLDVQHCWVYKQPNGIKSPCSAALSRKLLRLKSVFLEARYCINLWRKKRTGESVSDSCCFLTISSHVTKSENLIRRQELQLYKHFTEAEFVDLKSWNGNFDFLQNRSCPWWSWQNSRSHAPLQ